MLYISFEQAWQVYLDAAARLPAFPAPVTLRRVGGLADVVADYDLVVFDAYGVLHVGGPAFPESLTALAALRASGTPLCVVTNDVTHEPHNVADRLRQRGYDIRDEEIISGRSLLPEILAPWAGRRTGVIASHPEDLQDRYPDLIPLTDEPATWTGVDSIVFVDSNFWEEAHQATFFAELRRQPRPMIVCNPDVGCPYTGRISAEPGYFAHLAAAEGLTEITFLGKPFLPVYQRVLAAYPQISPARMLMVGDSPHTDILGGRGAGMDCLLLDWGFLSGQDCTARFAEAGLFPNFVASSL